MGGIPRFKPWGGRQHFSREEQAAYERNYYMLHPEKRKRKRETV